MSSPANTVVHGNGNKVSGDGSFRYEGTPMIFGTNFGRAKDILSKEREIAILSKDREGGRTATVIHGSGNKVSGDGSFRYEGTPIFRFSNAEAVKEFFTQFNDLEKNRIAAERESVEKAIAAERERIEAERQTGKERNWLIGGTLVLIAAGLAITAYRDKKLLDSSLVNSKSFVEAVSPTGTKTAASVMLTATGAHQRIHDPPHVCGAGPVPSATKAAAVAVQQQPELM